MSFNFMAAITICRDFGDPKVKSDAVSIVSPSISHEVMGGTLYNIMILNVKGYTSLIVIIKNFASFSKI